MSVWTENVRRRTHVIHDDLIKWKRFPRNWPFVRGIHRSPIYSPHKGQWRGALIFYLICAWTNGWANNRDTAETPSSSLWRYCKDHRNMVIALIRGMEMLLVWKFIRHRWILLRNGQWCGTNNLIAGDLRRHDTDVTLLLYVTLRWRHNGHDSVSNQQPHDCLLNRLFRSNKTSKLRVTGLCVGNSPGTGEFPAQMASYAENVSIWWRDHEKVVFGIFSTYSPGHCFSHCGLRGLSFFQHLAQGVKIYHSSDLEETKNKFHPDLSNLWKQTEITELVWHWQF